MPAVIFLLNILITIVLVDIARRLALGKHRAAKPWMWATVLCWPLALPILASLPKRD